MKLAMVDLDGTLFDTKDVNYYAYKKALNQFGFDIDYEYYRRYCNGRHYLEFLPQISTSNSELLTIMHNLKSEFYPSFLNKARVNWPLVDLLKGAKQNGFKLALVTTANKKNCFDILNHFDLAPLFDLIITKENVEHTKPNPEGFLLAMQHFGAKPEECIIFEDSSTGVLAAENAQVNCFVVKGYN